jgi:hypothetical protein
MTMTKALSSLRRVLYLRAPVVVVVVLLLLLLLAARGR